MSPSADHLLEAAEVQLVGGQVLGERVFWDLGAQRPGSWAGCGRSQEGCAVEEPELGFRGWGVASGGWGRLCGQGQWLE